MRSPRSLSSFSQPTLRSGIDASMASKTASVAAIGSRVEVNVLLFRRLPFPRQSLRLSDLSAHHLVPPEQQPNEGSSPAAST